MSRYAEWLAGTRPLPGQDAQFFFAEMVKGGLHSPARAADLLARHIALENGNLCQRCRGNPPSGFACLDCGAGQRGREVGR